MTKDEIMKTVFWYCVDILNAVSSWLGVTYEELNIWIFVIVHPMLTLFLMVLILSFNMTNDRKLFQVVKSELKQEIPQYRFTFDNLRKILNKQREMHPDIREDILSCIGLNLMNIDGKIAEHILTRFVESNIRGSWKVISPFLLFMTISLFLFVRMVSYEHA